MAARRDDPEQAYDLFKVYVEHADRASARRAGTNTFFVSLHSVIAAVVGYLAAVQSPKVETDTWSLATLSAVGIILSLAWWGLLRYYRRLSRAKWAVINQLETDLAIQPFTDEWAILHPGESKKGWRTWLSKQSHREATVVEQVVPLTFAVVYAVLAVRIMVT